MPRGKPIESVRNWIKRKQSELKERAEERTKLLPAGLQEEILEACNDEREYLMARIDEIDQALEDLGDDLEEAKAARAEAYIVHRPSPRTRRRADGTTMTVKPRAVHVKGQAAIKAGQAVRAVQGRIEALEQERRGRQAQLREVAQIEAAAKDGVVTALLSITKRWRNQINLTGLQPRVPLANRYTDRAGNPLPEEALGPDGEPVEMPSAAEAMARSDTPLIIEEG
jgi:hypothetical protein